VELRDTNKVHDESQSIHEGTRRILYIFL
jgi:hypothetical protein